MARIYSVGPTELRTLTAAGLVAFHDDLQLLTNERPPGG
ncbi:hypothetical protein CryarDRAFT_1084 [Cryptosporangium arvum DSM 44712]|uniref:Uncharacterized protein n=1 Tax=Cryptosporangium arvum DSM 44712 TaxID=927661 RepID=A0A010YID5_9ACTN|nr:hypothetical protein CryarDRAFT_1084 [Cryptosporangium arvum DSM 44712]